MEPGFAHDSFKREAGFGGDVLGGEIVGVNHQLNSVGGFDVEEIANQQFDGFSRVSLSCEGRIEQHVGQLVSGEIVHDWEVFDLSNKCPIGIDDGKGAFVSTPEAVFGELQFQCGLAGYPPGKVGTARFEVGQPATELWQLIFGHESELYKLSLEQGSHFRFDLRTLPTGMSCMVFACLEVIGLSMDDKNDRKSPKPAPIGLGLVFGVAAGAVLSSITDNSAWIGIGIAFGLIFGGAFSMRR